MAADAAPERYERGRRALRRRLAMDFEPLRDTLARGLDVPVQAEAAVYCTAAVEALCAALFAAAIPHAQAAGEASLAARHLQLALRSVPALSALLRRVPSASTALGFFLDAATSDTLYARRLIASGDAPHRRGHRADEGADGDAVEDAVEWHARAQREWTRRADAPFADEDFAAVLKAVHPAFSLAHGALALLDALVRELLNATCDLLPGDEGADGVRVLTVADVAAAMDRVLGMDAQICGDPQISGDDAVFRFIARTAKECVGIFADGDDGQEPDACVRTDVRFLVVRASAPAASSAPLGRIVPNVSMSAPFSQLVPLMCKRGRVADEPRGTWLAVYRGREVGAQGTPRTLGLPLVRHGSIPSAPGNLLTATLSASNAPFVFLVQRKWWDDTRRNEARRGRRAPQRPQDARVRSLVAGTESKVKRALRRSPSPSAGVPSASKRIPKRSHSRSATTLEAPSSSLPTSLSTAVLYNEPCMASGDDSLSALVHRPRPPAQLGSRPEEAARLASELADTLRTAALVAEAAAVETKRRPAAARDEWAARVRTLDTLVARTQAARAAAAQILGSFATP